MELDNLIHPLERLKCVPKFAEMFKKIQELEMLNRELTKIIPAPGCKSLHIANIRDQVLILHADSSAWANRLRYLAPMILQHLRANGWPNLLNTQVRVSLNGVASPEILSPKRPVLSSTTIELLHRVADDTPDPQLRSAWEGLANSCNSADE